MVYINVPDEVSVTEVVPDSALAPGQPSPVPPPLAVQVVASVELQVKATAWPTVTIFEAADSVTIGAGATVTAT